MNHELAQLAKTMPGEVIEVHCGEVYSDGPGMPPLSTRPMVGLAILKHAFNLADEEPMAAMQLSLPCSLSSNAAMVLPASFRGCIYRYRRRRDGWHHDQADDVTSLGGVYSGNG